MLGGGGAASLAIGWLYPADKLVSEVRRETGEEAFWLPFLWQYAIKFATPALLFLLFGYNFVKDCYRPYNGYPQWALFVFGWAPCLVIPTAAFAIPPLYFDKPSDVGKKLMCCRRGRASAMGGEGENEGGLKGKQQLYGEEEDNEGRPADTVRSNTSVVTLEDV